MRLNQNPGFEQMLTFIVILDLVLNFECLPSKCFKILVHSPTDSGLARSGQSSNLLQLQLTKELYTHHHILLLFQVMLGQMRDINYCANFNLGKIGMSVTMS